MFSASLIIGTFVVGWRDYRQSLASGEALARDAARAYALHARRNLQELRLGVEWPAR